MPTFRTHGARAASPRTLRIRGLMVAVVLAVVGTDLARREYFLIPSNFNLINDASIRRDALSEGELKRMIASVPATRKLLLLDTCHAGAMVASVEAPLGAGLFATTLPKTRIFPAYEAPAQPQWAVTCGAASSTGQVAMFNIVASMPLLRMS